VAESGQKEALFFIMVISFVDERTLTANVVDPKNDLID
jgi:hypothetical protein